MSHINDSIDALKKLESFQTKTTGFIFKKQELSKLKDVAEGLKPVFKKLADAFDFDLDVDGADFLAWQRGFGTPMPDTFRPI